jgi:hypothetical protein
MGQESLADPRPCLPLEIAAPSPLLRFLEEGKGGLPVAGAPATYDQ